MATYFGINPPFIGGQQNIFSTQTDVRLVKNDILQLLLTVPGERPYRPSFGTGIRLRVFDTLSDVDLSTMQQEIINAITSNDPRVILKSVSVDQIQRPDSSAQVNIVINFSLVNAPLTTYLIEVGVSSTGQISIGS